MYIFIFVENWMLYNARLNFFEWMRTGSNPPDINQFRMNTRNELTIRAECISNFVLTDSGQPEARVSLHFTRGYQNCVVTTAINT